MKAANDDADIITISDGRYFKYFIRATVRCYGNIYNLGHNILKLYNVLVQIRLTTSKTKRDI